MLLASLFSVGCAFTPKRPPATKASERAQITVHSGGACNELVFQTRPVYPEEAKKKHIQGTVSLLAVISKTGELRNIEVLKGDPLLVPAALAAARQWRYTPCVLNSETVEPVTPIDINFNLNQ